MRRTLRRVHIVRLRYHHQIWPPPRVVTVLHPASHEIRNRYPCNQLVFGVDARNVRQLPNRIGRHSSHLRRIQPPRRHQIVVQVRNRLRLLIRQPLARPILRRQRRFNRRADVFILQPPARHLPRRIHFRHRSHPVIGRKRHQHVLHPDLPVQKRKKLRQHLVRSHAHVMRMRRIRPLGMAHVVVARKTHRQQVHPGMRPQPLVLNRLLGKLFQ